MYAVEDITDLSTEQFDRTIKTNIYGTFFLTRAAVSGPNAKPGQFPQTGDFAVESQVDRTVGVQDDMVVKPESATVQEGHDSFDHYKAADKVR